MASGSYGAGNGPLCPANPLHGRTYSVDRGGDPKFGFRCMHSDHGGNGRKFTQDQIDHYEIGEDDMASIIESAARDVAIGKTDLDSAVAQVAKATKRGSASVRELLTNAVAELKTEAEQRAAEKAAQKEARMAKAAEKPKTEKAPRERKEHVEPAEFAAVRDRLGLRNKEVAAALAAAGMGATLSRVTELTHSKGSSRDLFTKFEAALVSYREANPAAAEAPAAE